MILINKSLAILITCGLLTELSYIIFVIVNVDRNIPLYMFIYSESFILFFLAYSFIGPKRIGFVEEDNSRLELFFRQPKFRKILISILGDIENLKTPLIIILFGVLFRITLLPTSYTTSDDIHRYLWEGKVLVNGFNPFTTPPEDSSLIHLRDNNYEMVTFKAMPAIYPPFSQAVFAFSYLVVGNSSVFLKIIYLVFEIVSIIFLLRLLVLKGINPKYIMLYAWLPLPIMEYFINAHIDPIGITFLVLFLYYFEKNKLSISSIMLALAFLSKLLAMLILPLIIKKMGLKKALIFYAVFLLTCIVFYLPFISDNPAILTGLFRYLEHWEFNGSIYNLLKLIFSRADTAHVVCAILLPLSILVVSFRYKTFLNGVFTVFLLIIMFSTTVYPWYLGWIAALNIFSPFYSVLSLFFTVNFSNFTPLAPKWKEYPIIWFIEYIPFYFLLVYDLWKRRNPE